MDTDDWHRVDLADVPGEGRFRSAGGQFDAAMTRLFAADGPVPHIEQDPELR